MKRSRRPGVLRNFALPLDASTSANLSRPPPCQNPLPHALTLMQTRVLVLARAPLEVGDEGLEADEDGDDRAHVARVAQVLEPLSVRGLAVEARDRRLLPLLPLRFPATR